MTNNKLRLAIQKSGRISDKTKEILKKAGFRFEISPRGLTAQCETFPLELLFLRSSDIPEVVNTGVADLGVLGENTIAEKVKYPVEIVEKLGFGKCRLSIAIENKFSQDFGNLADFLEGRNIATSYPNILQNYLDENKISANIFELSGSVEIAPNLGISEAICDLVSTGETLKVNGLKEVQEIFKSEVVLVQNKNLSAEKLKILAKFLLRIRAVLKAKNSKYILFNLPKKNLEKVAEILPGLKGPTVSPLYVGDSASKYFEKGGMVDVFSDSGEEDWVSVATVVEESDFWDTIDKLKLIDAEGILVQSIEKVIL
jgi:ATP phosphoribosyltransferase